MSVPVDVQIAYGAHTMVSKRISLAIVPRETDWVEIVPGAMGMRCNSVIVGADAVTLRFYVQSEEDARYWLQHGFNLDYGS
jgi:hypothetical protein